jgi:hypothetical protein
MQDKLEMAVRNTADVFIPNFVVPEEGLEHSQGLTPLDFESSSDIPIRVYFYVIV